MGGDWRCEAPRQVLGRREVCGSGGGKRGEATQGYTSNFALSIGELKKKKQKKKGLRH